ncbi:MAG: hypothetical protein EA426_11445 [Spirochaetaceae bacterium]|nr:MAG: hypothetical protein EA426_11445 [Spirochaetaceae bacterium]
MEHTNGLRVLFFGAGVLGSLYAARLHEAGHNVAIIARGKRYDELRRHGITLIRHDTGEQTVTPVRVLDRVPTDEPFDVCVVLVQRQQLDEALPALARGTGIASYIVMTNMLDGPDVLIDTLGRDRVLVGHVNAGGEREGHVVRYMCAERMTMGELDGSRTERLERIAGAFRDAGFPVDISRDMVAWKRCHAAFGSALCNAIYMAGGDNFRLARERQTMKKLVLGMREALTVVKAHGIAIEPAKLKSIFWIPTFVLVPLLARAFGTDLFDIGGARHARNARDEMGRLTNELMEMARVKNVATPVLEELAQYASDNAHATSKQK